jgi:phage gpG-like protein
MDSRLSDSLKRKASSFQEFKANIPQQIGVMAQRFYSSSFQKQGFTDTTFQPWQEVKRRIPNTNAYKYPKKKGLQRRQRAILVGTGRLQKSVASSLRSATFDRIEFGVPEVYARRHNEGIKKMPKRKFIGYSFTLMKVLRKKIQDEMAKVLKK